MNLPSHYMKILKKEYATCLHFNNQEENSSFRGRYKTATRYSRDDIKEKIIDNSPTEGYKIISSYDNLILMELPSGGKTHVLTSSLVSIIQNSTVKNGAIEGKYSLAWSADGQDKLLLAPDSEDYKKALQIRQTIDKKIKIKDLVPGDKISTPSFNNIIYLGKFWLTWRKTEQTNKPKRLYGGYSRSTQNVIPEYAFKWKQEKCPVFRYSNTIKSILVMKSLNIKKYEHNEELSKSKINSTLQLNRKYRDSSYSNIKGPSSTNVFCYDLSYKNGHLLSITDKKIELEKFKISYDLMEL